MANQAAAQSNELPCRSCCETHAVFYESFGLFCLWANRLPDAGWIQHPHCAVA